MIQSKSQLKLVASIVSYNSAADLEPCITALRAQSMPLEIKVFDNASEDDSAAIAQRLGTQVEISATNLGFSAGHNRNLVEADFSHALVLNPDCRIAPDFVRRLVEAMDSGPRIGMGGGKLLRMGLSGEPTRSGELPILDSAGMYFTPAQRHFDRGSQQVDRGQYQKRQLVFGITAAAVLYRKEMLEDIRFEDEYFDEDFFAYREDADLCWRAQLRGWRAVYEPSASGLHRRSVLPENRRRTSPDLNLHSLRNRYLMRRKNIDWRVRLRCFPYMWLRDLGILAYVLIRERTSLQAYRQLWTLRRRFALKREAVQSRRTATPAQIAAWFSFSPSSRDRS